MITKALIFMLVLLAWAFIGYISGFDLTTRGVNMGLFTFAGFFMAYFITIFMPSIGETKRVRQ